MNKLTLLLAALLVCSAASAQSPPWTNITITGTPTTLAGYGLPSPLDIAEGGTHATTLNAFLTSGNVIGGAAAACNACTHSGTGNVDGVAVVVGDVVLDISNSPSIGGKWVVQSGAWIPAADFQPGNVIGAGCDYYVLVGSGTPTSTPTNAGIWRLTTTTAITIGTSPQQWAAINRANSTSYGMVRTTSTAGAGRASLVLGTIGIASPNCVEFADSSGSIQSVSATFADVEGPCATYNATSGHILVNYGYGNPTSSAGTVDVTTNSLGHTYSSDVQGRINGLSGATTLTLTFAYAFDHPPACDMFPVASTAYSVTGSGSSYTAATFTFPSFTGTKYYLCF